MGKWIMKAITATCLCLALSAPTVVKAATYVNETSESATDQQVSNADARTKYDDALATWEAMTDKEKADVYKSIKASMEAENKVLDKFVKYGILKKEEVESIKTDMSKRFDDMKADKAFPIGNPSQEKGANRQVPADQQSNDEAGKEDEIKVMMALSKET